MPHQHRVNTDDAATFRQPELSKDTRRAQPDTPDSVQAEVKVLQ